MVWAVTVSELNTKPLLSEVKERGWITAAMGGAEFPPEWAVLWGALPNTSSAGPYILEREREIANNVREEEEIVVR